MSLRFLLDTNILSEPTKPTPHPGILHSWKQHTSSVCIAAPVWHELLYGCSRLPSSHRRERLEHYIQSVLGPALPKLPYDSLAAEWHAHERARLVAQGLTPPFQDGLIAAIAKTQNLVLVTRNVKDFKHFKGLQLEDWSAA